MKISIDTKEDSKEELMGALRMLQSILNEKNVYTNEPRWARKQQETPKNIFSDEPQPTSEAASGSLLGSLFSGDSQLKTEEKPAEPQEEPEEKPKIIFEY